jgi:uncharacterized protein YgiM (DUF1202 family)
VRILLLLLALATPAHAVQRAIVKADDTPVHQYPNITSPVLTKLTHDEELPVSSTMVRDVNEAFYWYKIRLPSGEYGYVQADRITAEGNLNLAKYQGVDMNAVDRELREGYVWLIALRGMGIAGYQVSEPQTGLLGAEGELSVCLRLGQRGYARRQFALGAAFQKVRDGQAILGSFIYRVFSSTRTEPELRLRGGVAQGAGGSSTGVLGLSAGARYPFSLGHGFHLAGYIEGGFLAPITTGASFQLQASTGLGFHF